MNYKTCKDFLSNATPESDKYTYSPELIDKFIEHALFVRELFPHTKALPKNLFLNYVLHYRVNDEDISDHRRLFFNELYPRIKNLRPPQIILQTNLWAAENVVYQAQDSRTASPLTLFRSGIGRCGEESTFLVCALRSVGVAARQVYVPRWSHSDSNHAWVEAFDGKKWVYTGAAEYDAYLNRGWFSGPATRAMLIHSKAFGRTGIKDEQVIGTNGASTFFDQTFRYAKARMVRFTLVYKGKPIKNQEFTLELLNSVKYWPSAVLKTDALGKAKIELGYGDIIFRCFYKNQVYENVVDCSRNNSFKIDLSEHGFTKNLVLDTWQTYALRAPVDGKPATIKENPVVTKQGQLDGKLSGEKRDYKFAQFYQLDKPKDFTRESHNFSAEDAKAAARANMPTIQKYLDWPQANQNLLKVLTTKDFRDISLEVLKDHTVKLPENNELYYQNVLNPRIALEMLTPWRAYLSKELQKAKITTPKTFTAVQTIWDFLQKRTKIIAKNLYNNLYWTPDVTYKNKVSDTKSLDLLFIAVLRTLGIPARINPADAHSVEFYLDKKWQTLTNEKRFTLTLKSNQPLAFGVQWAISSEINGKLIPAFLYDTKWQRGTLKVDLPKGKYRLTTSKRLQNGNQEIADYFFNLTDNKKVIELYYPTNTDDLGNLKRMPVKGVNNSIVALLKPHHEPSKHTLQELVEHSSKTGKLYLYFADAANKNLPEVQAVLKAWPKSKFVSRGFDQVAKQLNTKSLPNIVAVNKDNRIAYQNQGYLVRSVLNAINSITT